MYAANFYIKPQDILDRLSEVDKKKFNHCIFSNVQKDTDGALTITCTFIENNDINKEPECRYNLCDNGKIYLI